MKTFLVFAALIFPLAAAVSQPTLKSMINHTKCDNKQLYCSDLLYPKEYFCNQKFYYDTDNSTCYSWNSCNPVLIEGTKEHVPENYLICLVPGGSVEVGFTTPNSNFDYTFRSDLKQMGFIPTGTESSKSGSTESVYKSESYPNIEILIGSDTKRQEGVGTFTTHTYYLTRRN